MKNSKERKAFNTLAAIVCILAVVFCGSIFGNSKNKVSAASNSILTTTSIDTSTDETSENDFSIITISGNGFITTEDDTDSDYEEVTDDYRKEKAAQIMSEIITPEVYAQWEDLSDKERESAINEYYVSAGEMLGIEVYEVIFEDLPGNTLGLSRGNGYIYVDDENLEDVDQLPELLDTVSHEMRHQFQNDVIRNPEAFPDISDEVLEQWIYEFTGNNYISPEDDFDGYYNQAVEVDARDFAESVVKIFMQTMTENTNQDENSNGNGYIINGIDFRELFEQFCNDLYERIFCDYVVQ